MFIVRAAVPTQETPTRAAPLSSEQASSWRFYPINIPLLTEPWNGKLPDVRDRIQHNIVIVQHKS
jgi:hypothetical protein